MGADIPTIPEGHWRKDISNWQAYVPHWEKQLRANLEKQPDPEKRFTEWLTMRAEQKNTQGVRLIFIEQPYLAWAETIEKIIEAERKELREQIADEVRSPDER